MKPDLSKIKLLVTDVDGVLTDGGMYYFEDDNEAKKFNTRDGMAIKMLKQMGIKISFVTGEQTNIVRNRAKKLKVDFLDQGITDKSIVIESLKHRLGLQSNEVTFVGDGLNDLSGLSNGVISICPFDAAPEVQDVCDIITNAKGGGGVIYEVYEMIKFDIEQIKVFNGV